MKEIFKESVDKLATLVEEGARANKGNYNSPQSLDSFLVKHNNKTWHTYQYFNIGKILF